MSGGFFGFDAALPERRDQNQAQPGGSQQRGFAGFTGGAPGNSGAFDMNNAAGEEDLAVYQWGDNIGASMLEGGDDMNDETFGDLGDISASTPSPSFVSVPTKDRANMNVKS